MSDLVTNVAERRLGDVGLVRLGKTPAKKDYRSDGKYKILKFRDVLEPSAIDWNKDDKGFVSGSDDSIRGLREVREGDVLVTASAHMSEHIGKKAALVKSVPSRFKDVFVCGEILQIRPSSEVDSRWVLNFFRSRDGYKEIQKQVHGVHLIASRAREIRIPVPPMAEQLVRLAEIEKQFSRLDEAVANLKRVKANLKRYKAAVLNAAVEGRLVPTEAELARCEGRNFETGAQLLQRILETRRDQWKRSGAYKIPVNRATPNPVEVPEGWVWSTYEQVGRLQLGRQRAPKYHTGPNMRPYLRVQNVFEDRIDLSDVMEMDFPPSDFEKYQLAPGDLLLNEGQSPELLGRPAIYRGELPGSCFTNTLIRFRAAEGVSVDFALHVSRHNMLAGRFVDEGTITTNIAHLSLGRLATVEFPLPPIAEQIRIVAEVDRRLSLVRTVEDEVNANLKRAERLRQSVLARAFAEPSHEFAEVA